jgi:hypothetical protein
VTRLVASLLARFSLRLANAWLRARGSNLRYYRGKRYFVSGREYREIERLEFFRTKGRRGKR